MLICELIFFNQIANELTKSFCLRPSTDIDYEENTANWYHSE